MLKNAIESADHCSDSRKRRHEVGCGYEKNSPECMHAAEPRLWTFFITPDSTLIGILCNCKANNH